MFRFNFSYKDYSIKDNLVRGFVVLQDEDDLIKAYNTFLQKFPTAEVLGHLKSTNN